MVYNHFLVSAIKILVKFVPSHNNLGFIITSGLEIKYNEKSLKLYIEQMSMNKL